LKGLISSTTQSVGKLRLDKITDTVVALQSLKGKLKYRKL